MKYGSLQDKKAFEEFSKLIEKFQIKRIIETGTYLGWSAKELSNFQIDVDTIELNEEFYSKSKEYLQSISNVRLHLGSSNIVLNDIIENKDSNILFFLDAHWENYWPLLDELEVIYNNEIVNPVIIIHDFFVPGGNLLRNPNNKSTFIQVEEGRGSKFGYDEYNGIPLSFDFIKEKIDKIYKNDYMYHYTSEIDCVDSGLIYIYPKNEYQK